MAHEPNVSPLRPHGWRAIHGLSKVKSGMVWVDERHGPRLKRITEPLVRLSTRPIGPVGISKIPESMVKVDIPVSATVRVQPERIRLADLHLRATWVHRNAVARRENAACLAPRWMQTQGACQATSKYPVTPTERHFSLFFRNPRHHVAAGSAPRELPIARRHGAAPQHQLLPPHFSSMPGTVLLEPLCISPLSSSIAALWPIISHSPV